MSDRELVRIKKFDVVGADERGLTAEFSLSRKQAEFVFITRKGVRARNRQNFRTIINHKSVFCLFSGSNDLI